MNRALKRLQAKQAKHKPNRSREQNHNVISLMQDCFDLPDKLMRWLKRGDLYYTQATGWLLPKADNELLYVEDEFTLWVKQWQRVAERAKVLNYDDKPLQVILNSLKYHKPITLAEIERAEAVIDFQRVMYRQVSHETLKRVIDEIEAERQAFITLTEKRYA